MSREKFRERRGRGIEAIPEKDGDVKSPLQVVARCDIDVGNRSGVGTRNQAPLFVLLKLLMERSE
jgi:hypothetical protein